MLPATRYAKSGEVGIAYQVVGDGPLDLVLVPGFVSHVEQAWEYPAYADFLNRLASFTRLILFDKRGTGLSDRVADMPGLEQRMDDVRAVMDAAGSKRAALFGISEGGPMSLLFAATYPQRISHLILYGSIARGCWAPDYPWAPKDDEGMRAWLDEWRSEWGGPCKLELWAPSMAEDQGFRQWWARYLRLSASPGAVINVFRSNMRIDVRSILPTIRHRTLVLHRAGDRTISIEEGRYLAAHIPSARLVEHDGEDHLWWVGDRAAIVSEIEEFLTGERQAAEPDRELTTVMFTDIVASTERAARLGDRRWRDLLAGHDALMCKEIARYRGRMIKRTGDGHLVTFDGPTRAIRCAVAIRDSTREMGLRMRIGLHAGEIAIMGDDIGGIAVHLAARVAEVASADEVWVSGTVKDLVIGSALAFGERGAFILKGVPGSWSLFVVEHV